MYAEEVIPVLTRPLRRLLHLAVGHRAVGSARPIARAWVGEEPHVIFCSCGADHVVWVRNEGEISAHWTIVRRSWAWRRSRRVGPPPGGAS